MKPFLFLLKCSLLVGAVVGWLALAGGCQSEPARITGPHQAPPRADGKDFSKDITGPHQHQRTSPTPAPTPQLEQMTGPHQ